MDALDYVAMLEKLYTKHGSTLKRVAGAPAKTVTAFEKKSGHRLPTALHALWRARNGSKQVFFARPDQEIGFTFLSLSDSWRTRELIRTCAPQYEGYTEPKPRDGRIRAGWFEQGWVPFADFGGSSVMMVDMTPAKSGRSGQVIAYVHDPDRFVWLAPSFDRFLAGSSKQLRAEPEEVLGLCD